MLITFILVVALGVFMLGIIEGELSDSDLGEDVAEDTKVDESAGIKKEESENEEELERQIEAVLNFLSVIIRSLSVVFITIIAIVCIIFIVINIPYGKMRDNWIRKKEEKRLKKNSGYKSNKLIDEIQEFISHNVRRGTNKANLGEKVNEIQKKIAEIQKVYLGNIEKYGIKMYKYEKTFERILSTLQLAKENQVLLDQKVINTILEALNYPYNDIVGEGVVKDVIELIGKEIIILEGLSKDREK